MEFNKKDMKMRREKIKDLNELKGLPRDAAIRVEGDGRYISPLFAGTSKTPFQPASQVVYTICENVTKKKNIISIATENKLCHAGALGARKSGRVQSSGVSDQSHSGTCTASIPAHQSIGDEYRWSTNCVEDLLEDDIKIKYFTTDCDSPASIAAGDCYTRHGIQHDRPEHLKDIQHLGRALRRKILNTTFTTHMFPGRLSADRTRAKTRFADDVTHRCAAEHESAFRLYQGDHARVKSAISYCVDAIISCYQGDHALCKKKSFVCDGRYRNKWKLPFMKDSVIKCTQKDEQLFRDCLNYRLGSASLDSTRFQTNTQKSEAANRVYSLRNPKNITFSRNFPGRIHSAVHQINNGASESLCLQLNQVGCPITPGSKVAEQLKFKEKRQSYIKDYKKIRNSKKTQKYITI